MARDDVERSAGTSASAPATGLLELALRMQSVRNKVVKQVEGRGQGLDNVIRFYGSILE